jgi:hypothetical protein
MFFSSANLKNKDHDFLELFLSLISFPMGSSRHYTMRKLALNKLEGGRCHEALLLIIKILIMTENRPQLIIVEDKG